MKNNAEIDFRKAIKVKFEEEKNGDYHTFLMTPSPAQLRELCLLKFDNGLNEIDKTIFRIYFKVNETEDLRAAIFNFHTPFFKSVGNFLSAVGQDKATSIKNLNLIAVLVDFNPRPFNKFHKNSSLVEKNEEENTNSRYVEKREVSNLKSKKNIESREYVLENKNNLKKKLAYGVIGILGIFTLGYTTKDLFFPDKQCMRWVKDHYEKVDCLKKVQGIRSYAIIEPYDEREFERKELQVCDTTTFFTEGKPKVWYSKKNNVIQFFNMDGMNPENNAEIKKVTKIIIEKYVHNCK